MNNQTGQISNPDDGQKGREWVRIARCRCVRQRHVSRQKAEDAAAVLIAAGRAEPARTVVFLCSGSTSWHVSVDGVPPATGVVRRVAEALAGSGSGAYQLSRLRREIIGREARSRKIQVFRSALTGFEQANLISVDSDTITAVNADGLRQVIVLGWEEYRRTVVSVN